jgi:hypothetical protein
MQRQADEQAFNRSATSVRDWRDVAGPMVIFA